LWLLTTLEDIREVTNLGPVYNIGKSAKLISILSD
jgi:hypothetical protein